MNSNSPAIYLFALWPILFVVTWAIWNMMRDSRQEKTALRSTDWSEVQGKVQSSKIVWGHYEVTYEYVVNGKSHSGSYEINLSPAVPDRFARGARKMLEEAKQDVADFPVGSIVIIKFNPQDPQQSILLCRDKVADAKPHEDSSSSPKFLIPS